MIKKRKGLTPEDEVGLNYVCKKAADTHQKFFMYKGELVQTDYASNLLQYWKRRKKRKPLENL